MYGYGYYFDYAYLVLVVPALLLALWAQVTVKSRYNRYSRVQARCGKTAAEVAREMLDGAGLHDVAIERVGGTLSDHYDPRTNAVALSDPDSRSVAAIGVAAHEVGHAIQHGEGYAPMRLRTAIIPVTQIGSTLAIPLCILGAVLSFGPLVTAGIVLYAAVVFFQAVTLPVEFNASRRALNVLQNDDLLGGGEDYRGAKKVLGAAAMTYLAAMLVALMNLLRLLLRFGNRRR